MHRGFQDQQPDEVTLDCFTSVADMPNLEVLKADTIWGSCQDLEDLYIMLAMPMPAFNRPLPALRVLVIPSSQGFNGELSRRVGPLMRGILLNAPHLEHLHWSLRETAFIPADRIALLEQDDVWIDLISPVCLDGR